jgi:hypothetical protein
MSEIVDLNNEFPAFGGVDNLIRSAETHLFPEEGKPKSRMGARTVLTMATTALLYHGKPPNGDQVEVPDHLKDAVVSVKQRIAELLLECN